MLSTCEKNNDEIKSGNNLNYPFFKITDSVFFSILIEVGGPDTDGDGKISNKEALAVNSLRISGASTFGGVEYRGVRDVKGLEAFINLDTLYCHANYIRELDLSNNSSLKYLMCDFNALNQLNVTNNTKLEVLSCQDNRLTNLDITRNNKLLFLDCSGNLFSSLDVSNNTSLNDLYCRTNQLASLDVSNNTVLSVLNCGSNQLTTLDLSNNINLEAINIIGNPMTTLNISSNSKLERITLNYTPSLNKVCVWTMPFPLKVCMSVMKTAPMYISLLIAVNRLFKTDCAK